MTHELKIWLEHYNRVKNGTKTFEIRVNDRAFQKGDRVHLKPCTREGESLVSTVARILEFDIGDVYPIDADRVVFSLISPGTSTTEGEK